MHISKEDFLLKMTEEKFLSCTKYTGGDASASVAFVNKEYLDKIEDFLEKHFPEITFLDYRLLMQSLKIDELTYCSDPSAGDTSFEVEKYIPYDVVYDKLAEMGYIEPTTENELKQDPSGLTKEFFIEAIKEYIKKNDITDFEISGNELVLNSHSFSNSLFKTEDGRAYSYSALDTFIIDRIKEKGLQIKNSSFFGKEEIHSLKNMRSYNFFSKRYDSFSSRSNTITDILGNNKIDLDVLYYSFMSAYRFKQPDVVNILDEQKKVNKKNPGLSI